MNKILTLFGLALLIVMISNPQQKASGFLFKKMVSDTLPDICSVLPAGDIAGLSPFTNPLTNSYTEEPLES